MTTSPPLLILASASPRRRDLLGGLGVRFEVAAAEVEEVADLGDVFPTPATVAIENASRKARAVARTHPGRCVLGADTVVACQGRLFGKPASLDEAREFLRALSDHTHGVITGCVLGLPDGTEEIMHEISYVTFCDLTDAIIEKYLAEVNVLDKAGAYAVQERGEWIIERVEGSRDNVIGLPTERLAELLQRHGLLPR